MLKSPLVDIHTHFFGPEFFAELASAAHPTGNPGPGLARLRAAGIEVPTGEAEAHAARWTTEMDSHGVDLMVTFASLPEEAASVARGVRAGKDRLVPFCLVNPAATDAPARVDELVDRLGMRGLVLFPAMHRYDLSDDKLDAFYRRAEHHRLPLLVHMGTLQVRVRDLLGLPSDFDLAYATPVRLHGAAERFPGLTFVIPHFGGGYFEDTLALGRDHGNVAVDTSSSNSWIRLQGKLTLRDVFAKSLEVFGPRRIHFGTDSSTFPRGWRDDIHRDQALALESLGLDPEDQALIFGGNTRRLLGLSSGG